MSQIQTESALKKAVLKGYGKIKASFPHLKGKALEEKVNNLFIEIRSLCSPDLGIQKNTEFYKFFDKRRKRKEEISESPILISKPFSPPSEGDVAFLDWQIRECHLNWDSYY